MGAEGTNMVGKYLITAKIAEGGMGAIYKAKHPTLDRTVILKRLTLKKNSAITERFKREAQLMMDFRNDNIVQVYDHFKEGNSYYIAMEFVDGISLGDLIEKKRFIPNEIAMLIFREICKALKYAHDKGVIHRDIKPENVLISKEGEVKLTDFGIATSKDTEDEGLTSVGMTLGTPAYMSPEQISNTKTVDNRADIYSMGVVLYKMLTGKTPFPGNFTPDAISQINTGEYIYPRKINPRISPLLQKIIKKAMHCKLKKRYKDLQHIMNILSKELKKKYKDRDSINGAIRAFLQGKEQSENDKIKSTAGTAGKVKEKPVKASSPFSFVKLFVTIVIGIFVLAIIAGAGAYYAYKNDLQYEYLKANEYGALTIAIKAREQDRSPEDNFVEISLYEFNGRNYKRVTDIKPEFKLVQDKEKEKMNKYYTIQSRKMYLKTSNYRLFVNSGNQQFQKDFYLFPRAFQKNNKDASGSEKIEFFYRAVPHLPMSIYYKITDVSNNNDITNDTDFYVYVFKDFMLWKNFVKLKNYKDILMTGRTHRFAFKKEGYYADYRIIYVKPHETTIELAIDLMPIPGELLLRSNVAGLDILLNNSSYFLSGEKFRQYSQIKPASTDDQRLALVPGDYYVTVKKGKLTKTVKVTVMSNMSTQVIIDYNKEKSYLELETRI
jgi:eukaryotic-like serine/threonine-protein kinase